jgi:hypothetical protein
VEVQLHALLDSALDGNNWSASQNGLFVTGERAAGSDWIGDVMGPNARLKASEKRENIFPPGQEPNNYSSVIQKVALLLWSYRYKVYVR